MKDNPSGATMLERTKKVYNATKYILETYPQTRGDKRQLVFRFCKEFTGVRITFSEFCDLLRSPAFGTITRRGREIQNEIAKDSEGREIRDSQGNPVWANPELRPSKKTEAKRFRLAEAYKHYYGAGLKLSDYIANEAIE